MSVLVAARMRTSTLIVCVPPRRMNSFSCMTRRSLAWVSRLMRGDLVEEDGPLVGRLEEPFLQGHGAGEGALDVAEQVALEQVGRQGAAVDGDERGLGPVRVHVDGPGDELLAGAALALEEDRAPGRGGGLDEVEDVLHGLALADDVGEAEALPELVLEPDVLVLEALALEGLLDGHEQELVVLERLLDVVEGADLHGRDGRLDRAVGRDDDDRDQGIDPLDPPQDLDAVHPRHEKVEEDDVEGLGGEFLQRLLARARDLDLVALRRQELGQDVVDDRLVVDDVDDAFAAHGRCPRRRGGRLPGAVAADRQGDGERRAAADLALDVDAAVVLLDDGVADGQAETGPLADALGREERIEDAGAGAPA